MGGVALFIGLLLCLWGLSTRSVARDLPDEWVVVVEPGTSIRDIAAEYLDNPDLWEELLGASGLRSVTEVTPGSRLTVPWNRVSRANFALVGSKRAISEATAAGARLFAPDLIGDAIRLRDQALVERSRREWENCFRFASDAWDGADQARVAALQSRDVVGEALLSDRSGDVQRRAAKDLVWRDAELNAVLLEEEKVRTLSASNAELLFRDESRLRLGENSQAVIQRMRVDPLTRSEQAKVSLKAGDVYALLGGGGARQRFELEVPGVETEMDSRDFWVSHDRRLSRFANYDDRHIKVSAKSATVVLGRNQGTLVRHGERPEPSRALLPAPRLEHPDDHAVVQGEQALLRWTPVDGALVYSLEVATDPSFSRLVVAKADLLATRFPFSQLDHGDWFRRVATVDSGSSDDRSAFSVTRVDDGRYYWRVSAVDQAGLPGVRSEVRVFVVRRDRDAPYLVVKGPADGERVHRPELVLSGETEPGASLALNGRPLRVATDGSFETTYSLQEGDNRLHFEARDAAGHLTEQLRRVRLLLDSSRPIRYDPGLARLDEKTFVTRAPVLALVGVAGAGSRVTVRPVSGAFSLSTVADPSGAFQLNLPLPEARQLFDVSAQSPAGTRVGDRITVVRDQTPPQLLFERPPPSSVGEPRVRIVGRVEGGRQLSVDGAEVALDPDGRFALDLDLQPGKNRFALGARRAGCGR